MLNAKSWFSHIPFWNGNATVSWGWLKRAMPGSAISWAITGLSTVVVGAVLGTMVLGAVSNNRHSVDTVSSFRYDPVNERWFKTVRETVLPDNPDGSLPPSHHTIEIFLNPNDPVKLLTINEVAIIDPSGNLSGALLEIKGHEPSGGGSGKINIGTLSFIDVDAEELKIDADIVRTTIENTGAKDNELDLDLNVVNVVRTGRGASNRLFLGRGDDDDLTRISADEVIRLASGETGLRVDRIRIIGPNTGTAFVESLLIRRSSVFGKIEVDDVRIQDLILKSVSLDDNL